MGVLNSYQRDQLDRWITGNYGEDQHKRCAEPSPSTVQGWCPECKTEVLRDEGDGFFFCLGCGAEYDSKRELLQVDPRWDTGEGDDDGCR